MVKSKEPANEDGKKTESPVVENKSHVASNSDMSSADVETNNSQPVDADVIETLDTEDEVKSEENGDVVAEKQPLRGEGMVGVVDEELGSKDDLGSDSGMVYKKSWDVRCVVVGVLVVLIMVGGATAAILVHRFKGKPTYEFKFANYYEDSMVLQRAPHKAVVWGYGPVLQENTTVELLVKSDTYTKEYKTYVRNTAAGQTWRFVLDSMTDSGPFTLRASLADHEDLVVTITDVLFGDVWLCAGSGNMQYSVDLLDDAEREIEEAANYTNIRLFSVFPATSDRPHYNMREIELHWSPPNRASLVGQESSPHSQFKNHFSAQCWLFGKELHKRLGYPVGLVTAVYGNSAIQEWASSRTIDFCKVKFSYSASKIWNAMINPLLHMSMYGLIWDQGEKDGKEETEMVMSRSYNCTLVELFREWRKEVYVRTSYATDRAFPIGIVQLGPNRLGSQRTYGATEIRWQQTANYGYLPNDIMEKTFMAVTIDLPDVNSTLGSMYHRYKREVADRLLKGALYVAYRQRDVKFQGPFPAAYQANPTDETLVLHFETSITGRTDNGFEVCCTENRTLICLGSYIEATYAPGRKWAQTPIIARSSTSVTLNWAICRAQNQNHVVGLRYAWRETPCNFKDCAIYSEDSGLPMAPYIRMNLLDDGARHSINKTQIILM